MQSRLFEQVGSVCAGLAGLAGFGYSTAFVIYLHNASRGTAYVDDVLLVLGGLAATAAFVAVCRDLRRDRVVPDPAGRRAAAGIPKNRLDRGAG